MYFLGSLFFVFTGGLASTRRVEVENWVRRSNLCLLHCGRNFVFFPGCISFWGVFGDAGVVLATLNRLLLDICINICGYPPFP